MASEIKERNALAELAKFLKGEAGSGSAEFKAKVIEKFGEAAWNRHVERKRKFERASRIVAELAKVEYYECLDGVIRADGEEINAAFRKCRAIAAEEGAKEWQASQAKNR